MSGPPPHPRAVAGGRKRGVQLHARRRHRHGRRVPHKRDRQHALALTYPVQHMRHEAFLEEYYFLRAREGRQGNRTGAETHWRQYCVRMRQLYAMGQCFSSTNKRTARAMELAKRPRCERTTRRVDRGLEAMGVLRRTHVKRGGWRAGNRDFLCLMIVHRSCGEQQQGFARAAAARDRAVCDGRDDRASAACGGRERKPAAQPPANGGDEGTAAQLQLALPLAQRAHGFSAELEQLAEDLGGLDALNELLRAGREQEFEP